MQKWLSNLIILSLVFAGLALSGPEVDRLFFSEVVMAPQKVSAETSNLASKEVKTHKEVQIAPKNDTINNSVEKTATEKVAKASGLTWDRFNQMSQSQLESINGIGPVLAKRILDYKAAHGPFASFEALNKVKGIGPKLLEKIKKQFTE